MGTLGVSEAEWLRGEEGVRRGRGVGSLEVGVRRAEAVPAASDPKVPRVRPEDRVGIQDPEAQPGVGGLEVMEALTWLERW